MRKLVTLSLLTLAVAAPAAAQQQQAASALDKKPSKYERIVCKTMQETGSLIKKHKTCKSQAAWDKEADAMRSNGLSDSCAARAEGGMCQ